MSGEFNAEFNEMVDLAKNVILTNLVSVENKIIELSADTKSICTPDEVKEYWEEYQQTEEDIWARLTAVRLISCLLATVETLKG